MPALDVRFLRLVGSDMATELTAARLDHILAQRGVDTLNRHEHTPPPGEGGPAEHGPWARDDARLHTHTYTAGRRVLRAAMADDAATMEPHDTDVADHLNANWTTWPMTPAVVMGAVSKADDLVAPQSV